MKLLKRLTSFAITLTLVISSAGQAFAYPGFGEKDAVVQDYIERYGWDEEKSKERTWTGIDGETYERTNLFEASMFQDVKTTNNELALDLGIITSYSNGMGNIGGGASIVAVARRELEAGICEVPPNSNNTKYHQAYGISPCAWCALFVSWCADQCGYLDSGLYIYSLTCLGLYNYMTSTNGFNSFHVSSAAPFGGSNEVHEGDLVFWVNDGFYSHIGIVSGVTDNTISIISGNAGAAEDRVSESTYSAGSASYPSLWNGFIVSMEYPQSGSEPILNYLVNVMGTTVAGACGALANIEAESNFVTDINEFGNGIGYGLCQWSFTRRDRLFNYCAENGLDVTTLDGQLAYLRYELEEDGYYAPTYNALMYSEESGQGAYDSGVIWCKNFEAPKVDSSAYRGSVAQNTYWPLYQGRVSTKR